MRKANKDVCVELADVYKGIKYDNTCFHYFVTYNEKVISYENSIGK